MVSRSLLKRLRGRLQGTLSHNKIYGSPRNGSTIAENTAVLHIPKADVYRFGDANKAAPVFRGLEWSINLNESWAIVGSGSGEKSSLFDMLMGHLRIHPPPPPPAGLYPFLADAGDPHNCVSIVSFANKRSVGGAFYDYTARYGAVREEDRITLRQSMFPETINDLKAQTRITLDPEAAVVDHALFEYLVEKMGLAQLLDLPRIALSNGQTRRARILKALLAKPRLLLLDEPLTGLDVDNRATVLKILHELHRACNPHIVVGLRVQDAVPEWITHLAVVSDGEVKTGPKDVIVAHIQNSSRPPFMQTVGSLETSVGKPVVEMNNVSVTYGPRRVLKNITWTIREGQRYHLQGPNGSGKTTLLALLTGDHPQSYTQLGTDPPRHLHLFGTPRARLATQALRGRIGLVSPELADAFPRRAPGMSVWEALGTGFDGGFVPQGADGVGIGEEGTLTEAQRMWRVARCWEVLAALGPPAWRTAGNGAPSPRPAAAEIRAELQTYASLRFAALPAGEQRMVLLMRALVGARPLVLLDEVWSGMDARMVTAAHVYLRTGGVGPHQAVLVVTHVEEEVPWGVEDGVIRVRLEDGEMRGAEETR
ncbi:P-loop containing nucleoside triphosphate hydrolase protein [Mycena crocata]|nr:P-loop containing nucleoside triphosphate hydrolase protein [Mycena crocata]